jgi:hypothetical protein
MVYKVMSIAMAMRVRRAAIKERSDANMASVTCEESDNRRAMKVAPAAIVKVTMTSISSRKQAEG